MLNNNFVLTNLILTMEGTFTYEDAFNRISQHIAGVSKKTVRKTIERLRDNDYLDELGSKYTVIPQEKSMRWG